MQNETPDDVAESTRNVQMQTVLELNRRELKKMIEQEIASHPVPEES